MDQTKCVYGALNLERYIKIQITCHIVEAWSIYRIGNGATGIDFVVTQVTRLFRELSTKHDLPRTLGTKIMKLIKRRPGERQDEMFFWANLNILTLPLMAKFPLFGKVHCSGLIALSGLGVSNFQMKRKGSAWIKYQESDYGLWAIIFLKDKLVFFLFN